MHPIPDRPRFQLEERLFEGPDLDPSLDPCALTPLEPKPDPRLTWGATGLLASGAATALLMVKVAPLALAVEARKTVAVSLSSEVPTLDPEAVSTGGRAGGGEDAFDPRRVSRVEATLSPQVTMPEVPLTLPDAPSVLASGMKDLPQLPGGSGLPKGAGEGSGGSGVAKGPGNGSEGTGRGSGSSPGKAAMRPPSPDYRLVVVYSQEPTFHNCEWDRADVKVAIEVNAQGRVTAAKAVQGPELLWINAEACALKWRFEPLAKHGLTAPQHVTITFHYRRWGLRR